MRNVANIEDLRVRLLVSGSIAELFRYPNEGLPFIKRTSREKSMIRARTNLRRTINANARQWRDNSGRRYMPLFLTLTFANNITDVYTANKAFTRFIRRFNYSLLQSKRALLKYSVVIEFQKRGAVHYHAILYNLPFIPSLHRRIVEEWGLGYVYINPIASVKNLGSYVVKYMTKELSDPRLEGRKAYFSSRGLKKPVKYLNDAAEDKALELPDPFMELDFEGVRYSRYFLGDYPLSESYPQHSTLVFSEQGVLFS